MARIVVTGGGTGGHLYPALAVVEVLQQDPGIEAILYIGNANRKEAQLVPQYGIPFEGLTFSGMPRRLSPKLLSWGWELIRAFLQARSALQRFRPHAVLGTGGYVTAPVLLAARSLGIPYIVHEPDAYPGLVNRVMARGASGVTCAFTGARTRLKTKNLTVTGNPLRSRIGSIEKEEALANLRLPLSLTRPILLVTGGSQGARRINQGVIEALPTLIDELGLQIIHQTGETLFDEVCSQCPPTYRNHDAYHPMPFIADMASTLALADVAVCRSGSMTLSEMYRGHIPTILVPYPYAAADHQRQNALASQQAGASIMVEDDQFTGDTLVTVLSQMFSSPETLVAMRQGAEALAAPNATMAVISILKSVMR